jgi:hypothetical protein
MKYNKEIEEIARQIISVGDEIELRYLNEENSLISKNSKIIKILTNEYHCIGVRSPYNSLVTFYFSRNKIYYSEGYYCYPEYDDRM